jgi:hypothetical protein
MGTTIRLSLPADPAFAVVARTTAASIAAGSRASVDAVEDVRVVASELFALALNAAEPESAVHLTFTLSGIDIDLEARTQARNAAPIHDTFAWAILEGLLDDFQATMSPAEGSASGELTLRGRLRLQVPA